jgi:5-formaminoimidazole-4-carboxamide-1-beta-D-ribofuranosyl 5'-monophosphate synthetase
MQINKRQIARVVLFDMAARVAAKPDTYAFGSDYRGCICRRVLS